MTTVYIIMGFPSSGKSTLTSKLVKNWGAKVLNRDTEGGSILSLLPKLQALLEDKVQHIVLDNLFPTAEVRKPFIELSEQYGADVHCLLMGTSIEDSMFNAVQRAIGLLGKFPTPEEVKKAKHPNIFPPLVLFKYKKEFEKPTLEEGFYLIDTIPFVRMDNPLFVNKAIITDYDGCLRQCINGNGKYPLSKDQIEINHKCKKVLLDYKNKGYKLLGVSNQSGIAKGELSYEKTVELFDYTNEQLGLDIEYRFCSHQSAPISCYCRKPQVGFGVELILKHKLDRKNCIMVGDLKTDETFAKRCGFQYVDQKDFYV